MLLFEDAWTDESTGQSFSSTSCDVWAEPRELRLFGSVLLLSRDDDDPSAHAFALPFSTFSDIPQIKLEKVHDTWSCNCLLVEQSNATLDLKIFRTRKRNSVTFPSRFCFLFNFTI